MQMLAFDSSEAPTLPCSLADRLEPWAADTESMDPVESARRPSARFFETAGATHPGRVRAVNEDAYAIFPEAGFCAVADGLGGRRSGDVASRLAIHEAREFLAGAQGSGLSPADVLAGAVAHANAAVHAASGADPRWKGMATTFVGLLFAGPVVAIAHVGDSRAYRIRGGAAERLTVDHSMREIYLQMYGKRADPAVAERNASIVTRALGARGAVEADVRVEVLEPGDAFLLCSDGLWGLVHDDEIAFALAHSHSLEGALATLIATAYNRGGPDNITGAIVRPRIAHVR
jgi:protein phosphatase